MNRSFANHKSGSVAMIFAISFPVFLGASALALDYAEANRYRTRLQMAADTAVLASARELTLGNKDLTVLKAVAQNFMESSGGKVAEGATMDLTLDAKAGKITLDLEKVWTPFFAHYFSSRINPVKISATARVHSTGALCFVGLAPTGKAVVHLDDKAQLVAKNCGFYSNSNDPDGFTIDKSGLLSAKFVCSAGGIKSDKSAELTPTPIVDCPPIKDPLEGRPTPPVGPCVATKLEIKDEVKTLSPGNYCGGLTVSGSSMVTLNPGVYVISGGKLTVTDTTSIKGENVGFFFTEKATLSFDKQTEINLTAPKDGIMAGLLIFEDPNNEAGIKHKITSDNARTLLGTIYLPRGSLEIDSDAPIADQSAYTAIIAWELKLKAGPTLFLNSDYAATDIPVPDSLIGGKPMLDR
ncbi:MAG: pilus assembly protein [Beijerinckiaceae bacterium]|jgi:hypothetical protein|nr:pilus assembly protein [Beijerinckiaceae bacterium]